MLELTLEEVKEIHSQVQRRFNITRGINNEGLLDSITQRPGFTPYTHNPFPDVYSKCASLIEGIIKWHPFTDGNKRTALSVANVYMYKHGYMLVLPLSAVRFSVLIAKDEKGIQEIAEWVRNLSAKDIPTYREKLEQHLRRPTKMILDMFKSGQEKKATDIVADWLAFDIYPEYAMEMREMVDFLLSIQNPVPLGLSFKRFFPRDEEQASNDS